MSERDCDSLVMPSLADIRECLEREGLRAEDVHNLLPEAVRQVEEHFRFLQAARRVEKYFRFLESHGSLDRFNLQQCWEGVVWKWARKQQEAIRAEQLRRMLADEENYARQILCAEGLSIDEVEQLCPMLRNEAAAFVDWLDVGPEDALRRAAGRMLERRHVEELRELLWENRAYLLKFFGDRGVHPITADHLFQKMVGDTRHFAGNLHRAREQGSPVREALSAGRLPEDELYRELLEGTGDALGVVRRRPHEWLAHFAGPILQRHLEWEQGHQLASFFEVRRPTFYRLFERDFPNDADDLCQELYERFSRRVGRKGWPDNPVAYLWKSAPSVARDFLKKKARAERRMQAKADELKLVAGEPATTEGGPDLEAVALSFWEHAHPDVREVVRLREKGLTHEQIAQELGCVERTVRRRLERAQAIVRAAYAAQGYRLPRKGNRVPKSLEALPKPTPIGYRRHATGGSKSRRRPEYSRHPG